jgi:hypothetical protein
VLDGRTEFPGRLRQQIGIAAIDPVGTELGGADEIVEIELSYRSFDGE